MPAKHVLLIDEKGNASSLNNFEVQTQKLNHWKGWMCWTGSHSLHIDSGGEVFRGTCTVGGPLGNIFADEPIDFAQTQTPVVCTKEVCGCAFDYSSAKVRSLKSSNLLEEHVVNEKADLSHIEVARPITPVTEYWVSWGIGLRCNYSC